MKDKIKDELHNQVLENYRKPENLAGPDGLLSEMKRRLINRVMDAEFTTPFGLRRAWKGQPPPYPFPHAGLALQAVLP